MTHFFFCMPLVVYLGHGSFHRSFHPVAFGFLFFFLLISFWGRGLKLPKLRNLEGKKVVLHFYRSTRPLQNKQPPKNTTKPSYCMCSLGHIFNTQIFFVCSGVLVGEEGGCSSCRGCQRYVGAGVWSHRSTENYFTRKRKKVERGNKGR